MHLRFNLQGAYRMGDYRHPQRALKEMGITYKHGIPQSVGDQWWFLDCEGVPEKLPVYIQPMNLSKEAYEHWTS